MSWKDDVDELNRQVEMAGQMGGHDSVAFHHGRGKLTVRERIALLEDPGTFQEIGAITGTATWDGPVRPFLPWRARSADPDTGEWSRPELG